MTECENCIIAEEEFVEHHEKDFDKLFYIKKVKCENCGRIFQCAIQKRRKSK